MTSTGPISVTDRAKAITFFEGRTPTTDSEEMQNAFIKLADFDQSGLYLTHYSGYSEWERHPRGDELVQVVEGETTLILLIDGEEVSHALSRGEIFIVPKNTWHRFESSAGLQVLTLTPPPTEHSIEKPR